MEQKLFRGTSTNLSSFPYKTIIVSYLIIYCAVSIRFSELWAAQTPQQVQPCAGTARCELQED